MTKFWEMLRSLIFCRKHVSGRIQFLLGILLHMLCHFYLHKRFNCFFEGKEMTVMSLGKEIDECAVLVKEE